MPNVVFVAPYLLEATLRFVDAAVSLDGARVCLITSESPDKVPPETATGLGAYVQIEDCFDVDALTAGVRAGASKLGSVDRLVSILEDLQVPLGEVRDRLGIAGMSRRHAVNFRDKATMKDVLHAAGVPCARHGRASSRAEAAEALGRCGLPVVVKPPDGAGARGTFRVDTIEQFDQWLSAAPPSEAAPVVIEEFMVGDEFSFDSVCIDGSLLWHSISRYSPTPLTVLENSWIQWCVLLPRDISGAEFDPIRAAAADALHALGIGTGLSHMEWFRRVDGTVAVSEVGARPPGAQITALMSYAHDTSMYSMWARLMTFGSFEPPPRRFAVGAAYLRPQGRGRIRHVAGLDRIDPEIRDLVVRADLPDAGRSTSDTYEGDGYVIVRHPETPVVERALAHLISTIRIELE